ncbi:MAG: hypothetical protein HXX08_22820 [Chloroflexi bacterium]|uniref:Uncharacterized protein n=1 Tax=Candidatus Chlorohelix allophototropha TaxID=3003348 RepID=A0A8T7M9M5_9CHLR|nr:hypothetical protein [Chloroflexota bacterium]WJW68634.1 hypothetical protein OZ401_004248 [Chloroflexota bacterium L227-S17]
MARRCAREGCKAWAKRGGELCASHQIAPVPKQHESSGLYEQILTEEELEQLGQVTQGELYGLDREIRVTMVAFARLFREGRFKDATMVAIYKARLLEARQHLLESGKGELASELETWLADFEDQPEKEGEDGNEGDR